MDLKSPGHRAFKRRAHADFLPTVPILCKTVPPVISGNKLPEYGVPNVSPPLVPFCLRALFSVSFDGHSSIPHRLQVRRRPHGSRHLRLHGGRVRGHLVAPHIPHHLLRGPPIFHRQGHEDRRQPREDLRQEVQDEEVRPRRDQPQGVEPRPLPLQVQVRRGRRSRPLRHLRPVQLPLRR